MKTLKKWITEKEEDSCKCDGKKVNAIWKKKREKKVKDEIKKIQTTHHELACN